MGTELILFGVMKISDGDDGYTALWMSVLNATEFNHLKMIKITNFVLYILPQYFERQEIPFPSCIPKKKWKAVCCYAKWRKWVFIWKDWEKISWRQQRSQKNPVGVVGSVPGTQAREQDWEMQGAICHKSLSSAALEELSVLSFICPSSPLAILSRAPT